MKKLYAGLAAAALTATGIACTAGAAHASENPWPSDLGYSGNTTSIAVTDDGTVYAASTVDDNSVLHVTTTTADGETSARSITLGTDSGFSVDQVWQTVVAPSGAVLVVGDESDTDINNTELWVVAPGSGTGTRVTGDDIPVGDAIALSADGTHGVMSGSGQAATFTLSGGTLTLGTPVPLDTTDGAWAYANAVAITNDGTAYIAGADEPDYDYGDNPDAADPVPTLWKLDGELSSHELGGPAISVAALDDGGAVVGESDDGDDYLQFSGGDNGGNTLPLDYRPDYLVTEGHTLWASGWGGGFETVDLSAVGSYTHANPVPSAYYDGADQVSGIGVSPDGSALYAVAETYNDDDETYSTSSLYQFTKPGKVSSPQTIDLGDGNACVDFTAPSAPADASSLSYVVTATDRANHSLVTVMGYSTGDDSGEACFGGDDGENLLDLSHAYDLTITADNGGMLGDAADGGSLLPGVAAGKVALSGTAQVGSTLTATTSGWPAGTTFTYEWGTVYSNGESGGETPIAGATQSTLALTAALAGQKVVVGVTGHLADHTGTTVWSSIVTVAGATQPQPQPQPVEVTKIKPATIKANTKKVKLALPGITVAKAPGKVKVYDGKKLIGKATIVNGKLVLKLKKHLSHGKHKLKLSYKGSAQVAKFNKSVKLKVK